MPAPTPALPAAGPKWSRARRAALAAAALLLAGGAAFWAMLPRPLFNPPWSAVLLARDGTLLGARIAADGQWRFPQSTAVPGRFERALLTYEDRRFHRHPGVDPLAMLRAARSNWVAGEVVSGASTITMQLARLVRQQGGLRRSRGYGEKAWQSLLALRIEASFSKEQVLALYASHAPFGGNVVGLEAAAWRYFGREPAQLSWAEAATLAVLPNAPGLITPGRARARLQQRRDALLRALAARGEMTALDLQLALAEPLVDAPRALPALAPHLLDTLRAQHPGQYRFHTTLDAHLQQQATEDVAVQAQLLARSGVGNVAAMVVDHRSFEVLAYVGNAGWGLDAGRALAVDIVQRPRSTGSILKPFLYAAMLDSGQLLPQMLVADVPTQLRGFRPENFDRAFRGAVPADVALAQSLNVPAVRMLRDFGYARFHELLQRMGFSTLTRAPDHYGLALILGGAEATLWDVMGAYANLADGARTPAAAGEEALRSLRWLVDAADAGDGGTQGDRDVAAIAARTDAKRAPTRPLSVGAVWLTQQALRHVARPPEEAGWERFADAHQVAWKTGTSWGLRDAWAVGSSATHTVGVWAGNADGRGVPGLTGGTAAAPLLFALHDRLPRAAWPALPVGALKTVRTCIDDGFLASDLCASRETLVPRRSHFEQLTPYHQIVHVDARDGARVHAGCAAVRSMRAEPWFVLPPALAHYYRARHGSYRPTPEWRADCRQHAQMPAAAMMEFIYPDAGGNLYVPVEMDGARGRAVLEVVHRDPAAVLYWHLDEDYAGRTELRHQLAIDLPSGPHRVTVVDAEGRQLTRAFTVLSRQGRVAATR